MLPFRGVLIHRPYPLTGLTTARWAAEVEPVEVRFVDLWLTQDGVKILALFGHTDRDSDLYPHVVRWRGDSFLEDGHTRAVRAALAGAAALPMRVFEVGNGSGRRIDEGARP